MERRDAPMVTGFDLIGHNRTYQIHMAKRVVAYIIDLLFVFAPLWTVLYFNGERSAWVYGVLGGVALYAYSVVGEAIFRTTAGKYIAGLEVRPIKGPMTFGKAAVRNIPKFFWFIFPFLDTLAGMLVDGDPRQRWSDHVLGTTVAQSNLIKIRVHRATPAKNGAR